MAMEFNSKEFWEAITPQDRVSINAEIAADSWSIPIEELYQHFADRFRRENKANPSHGAIQELPECLKR